MHRTLLAAAILSTSLGAAAPVSAQQLSADYNDRQTYDADLHPGDAAFDARVRLAARQACGERMGRVPLREYIQVRECKRDFIASARATAS